MHSVFIPMALRSANRAGSGPARETGCGDKVGFHLFQPPDHELQIHGQVLDHREVTRGSSEWVPAQILDQRLATQGFLSLMTRAQDPHMASRQE